MRLWCTPSALLFNFFLLLLATAVAASQDNCQVTATGETICGISEGSESQAEDLSSRCSLYLAESTIPGAGLGVFTATPRAPNDPIYSFDSYSDICIPIINWKWHAGDLWKSLHRPLRDYLWAGDAMGMKEAESPLPATGEDAVQAFCPGLDALANCHLGVISVRTTEYPEYDTVEQHRAYSTSVGAFSPYVTKTSSAVANMILPPGSELFRNYGENWFKTREYMFGKAPLWRQYQTAEALVDHLSTIAQENATILSDLHEILMQINSGSWESSTLNTLPKNTDDLETILKQGGSWTEYLQRQTTRDVSWLEKNGRCLDNIRVARATDPLHGHGAFATRDLPAGTVITTSPLQHIANENVLRMYAFHEVVHESYGSEEEEEKPSQWARLVDQGYNRQLLLNYCFGHMYSTVLLCPFGVGVNAINHDQYNANVKIRWAENFKAHNHTLVESGSYDDLARKSKPQLAFDYVAIRDISAGEELYLDYGGAWQEAWEEHVQEWTPRGEAAYAPAREWNTRFGEDWPLRDVEDQVVDPYPSHVQVQCHKDILTNTKSSFVWDDPQLGNIGLPCRILHRFREQLEKEDWYYTVELEVRGSEIVDDSDEESAVQWLQRTDVPRSAIRFVDKPGTSDLHLETTFRHDIRIPDDMFPNDWKNILQ